MTHDAELLSSGSPFTLTIRGGSWVPLDQWGMPSKSKNVSMILSEKTQLAGHQLRHAIADAGLPIDLYGPEFTPIGHDKRIAYQDYRYAVVVEACQEKNFFSEHLIDAIAYGCLPIYWGCPNIGEWFDRKGFFSIRQCDRPGDAAGDARRPDHAAAYQHIQGVLGRNQAAARAYVITEDWQIANCLRPFVEAL